MNEPIQSPAQPELPRGAIALRRVWTAMATRFELELIGSDAEHLEAVAAAIEDEVHRLDHLLSRYNPASEISRLNRHAATSPQRVDADVWQLLTAAEHFRQATGGFFDVTASSAAADATHGHAAHLWLDAAWQAVGFASPDTAINLGGIAKGFALDRAKELLARYGVESALLSAGTSSILALGRPPAGEAWMVDVRHPADDAASPIGRLALVDRSLSCSATARPGQAVSDLVDPHTRLPITGGDAVVVLASTGVEAEALSTALLAMGRRRATEYLAPARSTIVDGSRVDVAWVDGGRHTPTPHWPNLEWPNLQWPNLQWLARSHD